LRREPPGLGEPNATNSGLGSWSRATRAPDFVCESSVKMRSSPDYHVWKEGSFGACFDSGGPLVSRFENLGLPSSSPLDCRENGTLRTKSADEKDDAGTRQSEAHAALGFSYRWGLMPIDACRAGRGTLDRRNDPRTCGTIQSISRPNAGPGRLTSNDRHVAVHANSSLVRDDAHEKPSVMLSSRGLFDATSR